MRERNVLLVAAGFAPAFPQRSLDDPALKSARAAIDLVLRAHEPNPALAYDRHWNLVSANRMVMPLLEGVPARLLGQPFNILRLAFHPEGAGAAHRQPRRMVRASAGAAAPAVRGDRRSRTDKALSGAEGLSDPGAVGAAVRRQRRDPLQAAARRRGAELHFHHDDFRHAGRYHAVGTGAGDVLSRPTI